MLLRVGVGVERDGGVVEDGVSRAVVSVGTAGGSREGRAQAHLSGTRRLVHGGAWDGQSVRSSQPWSVCSRPLCCDLADRGRGVCSARQARAGRETRRAARTFGWTFTVLREMEERSKESGRQSGRQSGWRCDFDSCRVRGSTGGPRGPSTQRRPQKLLQFISHSVWTRKNITHCHPLWQNTTLNDRTSQPRFIQNCIQSDSYRVTYTHRACSYNYISLPTHTSVVYLDPSTVRVESYRRYRQPGGYDTAPAQSDNDPAV